MKLHFAHDEAAHYRKTTRRDEADRRKKKTKTTGKMPLSQVRLPGDEGKSERERKKEKNEKKIFTRMIKSVMMIKKMKPIGTAYLWSKRWTRLRIEAQKERKKEFRWGH